MTLSMTSFVNMVCVLGPGGMPSTKQFWDVVNYGQVEGALLPPSIIEQLCQDPKGLESLRKLQYLHYAGAPLSVKAAIQLIPHVKPVPCIGSTEAGGYFTEIRSGNEDWDYVAFQEHAGAVFEKRLDNLHELIFIRRPECRMQQVFEVYPDRDRFETNDLWAEHPAAKGWWKIIGRSDDYVYLSHGDGLHASKLEPEILQHPCIKSALIGGHGRRSPVLLIEIADEKQHVVDTEEGRLSLIKSLEPYIGKVNSHCHSSVQLSSKLVIFTNKDKPFVRTIKGSIARVQSLRSYEEEMDSLFD
jgi:acyl-coenzyme A synthetase/AMP-(fatty) acid ligase